MGYTASITVMRFFYKSAPVLLPRERNDRNQRYRLKAQLNIADVPY